MSPWLMFVLMAAATFRLTRLVVKDDFPPVEWARGKVYFWRARWEPLFEGAGSAFGEWKPRWWGELVSCHWCASGWLALGVTVGAWFATPVLGPATLIWLWWLGVWGAAAVLADRLS